MDGDVDMVFQQVSLHFYPTKTSGIKLRTLHDWVMGSILFAFPT